MTWATFDVWGDDEANGPEQVHVIPTYEEHDVSVDCWCGPRGDEGVFVHRDKLDRDPPEGGRRALDWSRPNSPPTVLDPETGIEEPYTPQKSFAPPGDASRVTSGLVPPSATAPADERDAPSVPDQFRRIVVYVAQHGRGGLDVPVGCTVGEAALLAAEMFGVRVGPNDRPSFGLRGTGLHASDPLPDDEDYELYVIGGTV